MRSASQGTATLLNHMAAMRPESANLLAGTVVVNQVQGVKRCFVCQKEGHHGVNCFFAAKDPTTLKVLYCGKVFMESRERWLCKPEFGPNAREPYPVAAEQAVIDRAIVVHRMSARQFSPTQPLLPAVEREMVEQVLRWERGVQEPEPEPERAEEEEAEEEAEESQEGEMEQVEEEAEITKTELVEDDDETDDESSLPPAAQPLPRVQDRTTVYRPPRGAPLLSQVTSQASVNRQLRYTPTQTPKRGREPDQREQLEELIREREEEMAKLKAQKRALEEDEKAERMQRQLEKLAKSVEKQKARSEKAKREAGMQ